MNEYRGSQHVFQSADLFIINGSVLKDRFFSKHTPGFAEAWALDRIEAYLAEGSRIEEITYDADSNLTVIGMNGSIHIGQESNQEVREEVSERSTRNHVEQHTTEGL